MDKESAQNIVIQLRSLVVENRNKADFFALAADLYETGYVSDIVAIQTVQNALDQEKLNSQRLSDNNTTLTAKLTDVAAALQDDKQPDDKTRISGALDILTA